MGEYPLINILVRTSNRPAEFKRMLKSITDQSYPNIRIIISYDNPKALDYIPEPLEKVFVSADRNLPFFYDCYLNDLKELVTDGYYIVVDDDDVIQSDILKELPLEGPGLIVQLQRQNYIVPKDMSFKRGQIGNPCIILHHSLKHLATYSGYGAGDYHFIKDILKQVELPFVPIVVVYSFGRGLGLCQ